MKIILDNRERRLIKLVNSLKNQYGFNHIEISVEKLDIGDITIKNGDNELLIIERKSLNDLASSIKDGRYEEQSYRLSNYPIHNHNILYLIEGIIGLPVFSNSPERGVGLVYFTGPTMGYLIGFLFACFFASHIKLEDNYFIIFIKKLLYLYRCKELWIETYR